MARKHAKNANTCKGQKKADVVAKDVERRRNVQSCSAFQRCMSLFALPLVAIRGIAFSSFFRNTWNTIANLCRRLPAVANDDVGGDANDGVGGDVSASHSQGRKDKLNEDHLVRLLLKRRDGEVKVDDKIQEEFQSYLESPSNGHLREMVILRGPPGIGKSTFALNLLSKKSLAARLAHVCSTDDFFTRVHADGREVYCFNEKKIRQNHGKNQERVRLATTLGLAPIIVDNTNMSLGEMAPYKKIAKKANYSVRIVEPREIYSCWYDLDFLQERNCNRTPAGKAISKAVLKTMLQRFEPSHGETLPAACRELHKENIRKPPTFVSRSSVSLPIPEYIGVCLEDAFGSASGLRDGLWAKLREILKHHVEQKLLDLSKYNVPKPLHVTTFHSRELKGKGLEARAALEDAFAADGNMVTFTIEAVAFIAGALACAVVTHTDPPIPAPLEKLLHVTLCVCSPWRPVQSNQLLRAILDASKSERAPVGSKVKDSPLWSFLRLDLTDMLHGDSVRVFEGLRVGDRVCTAYLIHLQEPLTLTGPRFRHN